MEKWLLLMRLSDSTPKELRFKIFRVSMKILNLRSSRGQTDRGYKKEKTNTDIRTPIFVSDNWNRIIEIAIAIAA